MRNKIVSFGDSFIFGSEQESNNDGRLGWPGRAAHQLDYDFESCAQPGCGNDAIARQIFEYFENNTAHNTLAVINWTWTLRWDFYIVNSEQWVTLGPTCVPQRLETHVGLEKAAGIIDFYNQYTGDSSVWNKWRSISSMYAAQQYIDTLGVPSVETYIDPEILVDTEHAPAYIRAMQRRVRPRLRSFEGLNFLDWSRQNGHEVTEQGLHPLESAHESAADLWRDVYRNVFAIT
jgi:hypothetical protein